MELIHKTYNLTFLNWIVNDKYVRKTCAWEDEQYIHIAILLEFTVVNHEALHSCVEAVQEIMDSGISNSIEVEDMTLEISPTTTNLFETVEPLDALLIDTEDLLNILREWSWHLESSPKDMEVV